MVKRGAILALVSVASVLTAGGSLASAQTDAEVREAKKYFDLGIQLAESERWTGALAAFRRSQASVKRPSTSYNIANALYRLGRPAEAIEELDATRTEAEAAGDTIVQRRKALRRLAERATGIVVLTIEPNDARVYVDDRPRLEEGAVRRLRLDPGIHRLKVSQVGYEPHQGPLAVERGGRHSATIELRALPPAGATLAPTSASSQSEEDRKPFVKRPGFWVLIGVTAAAGVAIGVAIALTRDDGSVPCGTTGQCASAPRSSVVASW